MIYCAMELIISSKHTRTWASAFTTFNLDRNGGKKQCWIPTFLSQYNQLALQAYKQFYNFPNAEKMQAFIARSLKLCFLSFFFGLSIFRYHHPYVHIFFVLIVLDLHRVRHYRFQYIHCISVLSRTHGTYTSIQFIQHSIYTL